MFDLVKDCFNKGAKSYDNNSDVQKKISLQLIQMLSELLNDNEIKQGFYGLDLGCGTGEFSFKVLDNFNLEKLDMIDLSDKMINVAKTKIRNKNIRFYNYDFDTFNEFKKYNLIFSNMSIHWSKNFNKLVKNILKEIKPESIFLVSFLNSSSFNFFKSLNFFDNKTINPFPKKNSIDTLLNRDKFYIKKREIIIEKKYKNPISFFVELKKIGANAKFYKKNSNLFKLRNIKKSIFVNFNVSCYIIKRMGS